MALAFDDGPSHWTRAVLSKLEKLKAHATFFPIGENIAGRGTLLRRATRDGDAVEDHTWSHPDLTALDPPGIRRELRLARRAIRQQTASPVCYFRPPGGKSNETVVRTAAKMGLTQIKWDVVVNVYWWESKETIYRRAQAAQAGSILLLHDSGTTAQDRSGMVAAIRPIVRMLRDRGYRLVTLPKMFR